MEAEAGIGCLRWLADSILRLAFEVELGLEKELGEGLKHIGSTRDPTRSHDILGTSAWIRLRALGGGRGHS
jgi:hypothetical protein